MADSDQSERIDLECTSKRRRIQHDYRRLSSSGYADDFEIRRKERLSNINPDKADINILSVKTKRPNKRHKFSSTGTKREDMNNKGLKCIYFSFL